MSTDSEDTSRVGRAGDEPESVKVTTDTTDTTDGPQSPYDIGLAASEDETGPKPLRPELEDEQVRDDR